MSMKNTMIWPLFAAAGLLLGVAAQAQETELETELETLVIQPSAAGFLYQQAQPVQEMSKEQIRHQGGGTLGEVLESLAGVKNASFGAGVGRPVIRGQSGARVKVLQNGSDSADLAAMSQDHSPMTEVSLGEAIEVIQGPATVLHGGGVVGGIVNVVDERIAEHSVMGLQGDVGTRLSSSNQGKQLDGKLKAGNGRWVLHLDGFVRDTQDYRSHKGRVLNSDTEGKGAAAALSLIGEQGFVGLSISQTDYDYGVPNLEADEHFRVKPKQTRYDLQGTWRPDSSVALGWIDEWNTAVSFNDYQHQETEPEAVVALFEKRGYELQSRLQFQLGHWRTNVGVQFSLHDLELCHDHHGCSGIANIQDSWDGARGSRLQDRLSHGHYFAHDTPMPSTLTLNTGAFVYQQRDWTHGVIEWAARIDRVEIESSPDTVQLAWRQPQTYYQDRRFTATTFSGAGTWVITDAQQLGLTLARVQRAPDASELLWNGDHHATFSYQLDNPDLSVETAYTLDANWRYEEGNNQLQVAVYYYHYDDYIYNQLKPFGDPFHNEQVYRHEQVDARFYGVEAQWQHDLNERWQFRFGGDGLVAKKVAKTQQSEHLPRIAPASLQALVRWQKDGWRAWAESKATLAQHQTANNESSTAGFVQINLGASYQQKVAKGELQWLVLAQNIGDAYGKNHLSYLKDHAPITGRNLQLGVRYQF